MIKPLGTENQHHHHHQPTARPVSTVTQRCCCSCPPINPGHPRTPTGINTTHTFTGRKPDYFRSMNGNTLLFHLKHLWEAEILLNPPSRAVSPAVRAQLPFPLLRSSRTQSGYLHFTGRALLGMSPICMQGGCMCRAPREE